MHVHKCNKHLPLLPVLGAEGDVCIFFQAMCLGWLMRRIGERALFVQQKSYKFVKSSLEFSLDVRNITLQHHSYFHS